MPATAATHRQAPSSAVRLLTVGVWKPGTGSGYAHVASEEPLEIRANGRPVAVTMRTPGDDAELAAGFALTEGIIAAPRDLAGVNAIDEVPPDVRGNVVDIRLHQEAALPAAYRDRRAGFIASACGICGQGTIETVRRRAAPLPPGASVSAATIVSLPDTLRAAQEVFAATGGLHAAGLFHLDGRLVVAREDIGRHNAVDKVLGYALLHGLFPLSSMLLMVSGRAGFEIVMKAWIAGVPVLASVSAPSSLAVQLADEADLTLVGFVRGRDFSMYSGFHRILPSDAS